MKRFTSVIIPFVAVTLSVVACTKKEAATEAPAAAPQAEAPAAAPAAVDPNKKADVEVSIGTEGDAMAFNTKEFEVKAGQLVKVNFKNNASPGGLQHNLLFVKPGSEQAVANASIQAGNDKGWVPAGDANVFAHTKLVNAGESDSVTFVAPAAGDYPYICTFPGHAMVMKGVMHVK
ncbi:MAG: hypothetical protein RJB38_1132 [Pseudomonadota bacterium]|jgi:azurin